MIPSTNNTETLHGPQLPLVENETPVVVLNPYTGTTYLWLGGLKFKNLINGETGEFSPEQAKKNLKISLRLCEMIRKNPKIIDLISAGGFEVKAD
jgi:hypothetical protein